MSGLFFKTLGRKITLAIALPLMVALFLAVELSYRRAQEVVRQNAAEEAAAIADLVATSFTLVDSSLTARPAAPTLVHRQVVAAMQADFRIWDDVAQLRVVDYSGVVRWSRRIEEVGTKLPDAPRLSDLPMIRVDYGFVVALVMAAVVSWLLFRTATGFELLIRSRQVIRCLCIAYATQQQRDYIMHFADRMIDDLKLRL